MDSGGRVLGLIAFDLDGTVFINRTDTYPTERVERAFAAAHEKGYKLAVATGRPASHLRDGLVRASWLDWIISSSGAVICHAGAEEPLIRLSIPHKLMREAVDLTKGLAFRRWLDTPGGFICEAPSISSEHWPNPHWIPPGSTIAEDVLAHPAAFAGAQKLMLHFTGRDLRREAQGILSDALAGRAEIADEGDWSLEVSPLGASKGAASVLICERIGVAAKDSVAFGDSGNDLSFADTPLIFVAMGSAEERVIARADAICPDARHDGVAIWLEQHIL